MAYQRHRPCLNPPLTLLPTLSISIASTNSPCVTPPLLQTERLDSQWTRSQPPRGRAASAMRRWLFSTEAGRSGSNLERRSSSTSPLRCRALRSSSSQRSRTPVGWSSPELGRPPQPQEQYKEGRSSDHELDGLQRWDGRSMERRLNEQGVLFVLVRSAREGKSPKEIAS